MPEASVNRGKLEILPASALTVIPRYQRTPKPSRVSYLRTNWDEDKVGLVSVARITEGEYKGRLHIYNGGTRWLVKKDEDPNYLFTCWVKEMTAMEAAKKFLAENKESQRPSAFARYRVGTAAGEASSLAIQKALAAIPLEADEGRSMYGNGSSGMFSAFATAERIVKRSFAITHDWDVAADHLAWSISLGRRAYPQHGDTSTALGHDADLIGAISAIGLRNPKVVGDEQLEARVVTAINTYYSTGTDGTSKLDRLFEDRQVMKPEHWRTAYVAQRGNMGGSESRGVVIQKLIVQNFNRGNKGVAKLRIES